MGLFRYINNTFRHDRNIKRMLTEQNEELQYIRTMLLEQKIYAFHEKCMVSREAGVSKEYLCDHEVVVSLTSFGKRIYDVHLAIESIMQGTVKPNRIVLWLSEWEFSGKKLPQTLEMQKNRGLQIKYCEDMKSYNKLIPSLKKYPEACIITIDDDALYECDLLERLLAVHKEYPTAVCACRIHKMKLNKKGKPVSYMDWDWCIEEYGKDSTLFFPTGVGGTLYPPHCFSSEVFNQSTFMELCPFADDIWFYAMRLLNKVPIAQVYTGKPTGYYSALPSMKIAALSNRNTDMTNCKNDVQLKAVLDRYDLYPQISSPL